MNFKYAIIFVATIIVGYMGLYAFYRYKCTHNQAERILIYDDTNFGKCGYYAFYPVLKIESMIGKKYLKRLIADPNYD